MNLVLLLAQFEEEAMFQVFNANMQATRITLTSIRSRVQLAYFAAWLQSHYAVRELVIIAVDFQDVRVNFIGNLVRRGNQLQVLNLSRCQLGEDRVCSILVSLLQTPSNVVTNSLWSLDLSGNLLGVASAEQLGLVLRNERASGLFTRLVLRDNFVGDAGVEHICNAFVANPNGGGLKVLDFSNNRITTLGATRLFRVLRQSERRLCRLLLAGNEIGDGASEELCLLLQASPVLVAVDLAANTITNVGAMRFVHLVKYVLSNVRELSLLDNDNVDAAMKNKLATKLRNCGTVRAILAIRSAANVLRYPQQRSAMRRLPAELCFLVCGMLISQ